MKIKRMNDVENYIKEKESVSIEELAKVFNISINTVRRDINELVKKGNIEKVYGGVRIKKESLINFKLRSESFLQEKKQIAKKAASCIAYDDVIFIDSGTTTIGIFDFVPQDIKCTVVTNSLDVVERVVSFPNITLFIVGSIYRKQTRSFVTLSAQGVTKHINITKAFMASTGISLNNGITNSSQEEYWIKKEVAENASELFLLVDHSKFDRAALLTYASLDSIDYIITDTLPSIQYVNFFEENGITLII